MTDSNKTLIAALLDRSGSMCAIRSDVEGGFTAFIDEQRKVRGECRVTLAQFNDSFEVVYTDKPLNEVPPLRLDPRGCTALMDAMGRFITETGERLAALPEDERPATVILAVMTDGLENSSKEWGREAIRKLVEQQTAEYGWQVLYMGANQDAVEVGGGIGVSAANSITFKAGNAASVLRSTAVNVAAYRASASAGASDPSLLRYSPEQRDAAGA